MEKKKLPSFTFNFNIGDSNINVILDNSYFFEKPEQNHKKNWHYHTNYELFFIGDQPLSVNTEEKTSEYLQSIVCIPPFFSHWTETAPEIYRFLFSFSFKKKAHTSETYKFFSYLFSKESILNIPITKRLREFARQIAEIYIENKPLQEEKLEILFKLIFLELLTLYNTTTSSVSSPENYLLKIDDIIFNNYMGDVSLTSIAERLHLSTKQVSRIINKNYHKSLPELLNDKKLNIAASLLLESDKTISEIIEAANFNNESYFYSIFKKKFGCSPNKYRKKFKQEHVSKPPIS